MPAIYPLRLLQLGFEGAATPGTLVAATKKLVGSGRMMPLDERDYEDFPRGVTAPVTAGGITQRKGSALEHEGHLTYEEILYALEMGLKDVPTPTGAGPYVWAFSPVLNAERDVRTCTAEFVVQDGSTKHYERESGYHVCSEFEVGIVAGEPATLNFTTFGRAEQVSTVTGSLTPITGRAPVPSSLFKLYLDDTWAGLGGTQKAALIRAATLNVSTGMMPDYTLDGRADLDFTQLLTGMLGFELSITIEHTAAAATEYDKWRTPALRFARLIADNGAAGAANKKLQFDLAGYYREPPEFDQEDGIELLTATIVGEYDPTSGKMIEVTVTNGLATLP